MTRFAFPGKCPGFGARIPAPRAVNASLSSAASDILPSPTPHSWRKCRRAIGEAVNGFMEDSVFCHRFVEVEKGAGQRGPCRLAWIGSFARECFGVEGSGGKPLALGEEKSVQSRQFIGSRLAREDAEIRKPHPRMIIARRCRERFAERTRCLDEDDVVQQRQRLKRSVGNVPACDAGFSGRRVKCVVEGERRGAFDKRVEAPAVTVLARIGVPFS